jgi:hypothetical protein
MPNAMDYDALAKMYASEQDPRRLTMNDALQNYSRQQKIDALIEEARSQQQWSNQQEELKNAAYIKQSNALADNYVRDKTNQWQADQAKQQAYTRDVIPRIAAYHAIGAYDKLLDDPSISDDFKNTLRNVPPEKRDAFLSAQLGFSPRDKTVAGLQNTDKKVDGNITTTGMKGAFDLEKERLRADARMQAATMKSQAGTKNAKQWEAYSISLAEEAKKETNPEKRKLLFAESVHYGNLAMQKPSQAQYARQANTPDWSKAGGQNIPTKSGPAPVQLPPSAGNAAVATESNKAKLKALWENGQ